MKRILLVSLFALMSILATAQTGTATLDASGSTISGGDGTGKIVSYAWVLQGSAAAPVVYVNPNSAKTDVTFTTAGQYTFAVTEKDNLGNVATGTVIVDVYNKQSIIVNVANSHIQVILK